MAAYSYDLPVVLGPAGAQPTPPATLNTQLLAYATSVDPGLTANLPGLLIEDISSTDTGGMVVMDQARVEVLNCLSPNVANVALLNQQAQVYGVPGQGAPTNTAVNVVFSSSTLGYVIPAGFLVGDGTYTYQVQGGTVIGSSGSSNAVTAIAVNPGSWSVGTNTVTQLQTSVPSNVTLTVTNPSAGTPGNLAGESYSSFRTRIVNAGNSACVSGPRLIKTLIMAQAGLTASQVSVQQASPGIRVIVVGGDVYNVANAIFDAVADVSQLVGAAAGGTTVTTGLYDYPNTYSVTSVAAVQQTFSAVATWNTTLSGFTGGGAFQSLVQGPIAAYINSLAPGQVINLLEMNNIFQAAVANILSPTLLTRLVWSIDINGSPVSPGSGESYIQGNAEGYYSCTPSNITVTQG